MKKILLSLVALLCVTVIFVQKAKAWDDKNYYWYNIKLAAYPSTKGLVYAYTDVSPNSLPNAEQYKEELNIQRCTRWAGSQGFLGEVIFCAIAKPTSDYNFAGWYSVGDDQNPEKLIMQHSEAWKYFYYGEEGYNEFLYNTFGEDYWDLYAFDGIGKLKYYSTEDNDNDYYEYAPLNSIYAVFGKVNADFLIDNLEEMLISESESQIDEGSLKENVLRFASWFAESNSFDVQISKPANDVGDKITLTFDANVEDKNEEEFWFTFKYWTDSKGNKFYDKDLKLTVTEKETYTCHFAFTNGENDGIKQINGEGKTAIYDLNGIYHGSNIENLQPGCYIINRKVHIVR